MDTIKTQATVYCLVSPELPELRELLADHFVGDPQVKVLIERRRSHRREGEDRRRMVVNPPVRVERRLAGDLEGRRFGGRRVTGQTLEDRPPLPPKAHPYLDHISFVKPIEPSSLRDDLARVRDVATGWREQCREAEVRARAHLIHSRAQGTEALSAALAVRDSYTWEHSAAVVWLAVGCARQMGLSEGEAADVHDVALLHDIGKLGIPDAILRKGGPLSDAEWEIMRQHPEIGARVIYSVHTLRDLAPAVRAEHERWDGHGYPDALAGEQIPIASRISFVCDAYHAMISDRPYRKALSPGAARRELANNVGTQFCPTSGTALLAMLSGHLP